jgi:hypothetical protein
VFGAVRVLLANHVTTAWIGSCGLFYGQTEENHEMPDCIQTLIGFRGGSHDSDDGQKFTN